MKKGKYELIITEKPQAAEKIASALSENSAKRTINGVSYYALSKGNKNIVVACAVGHLFALKAKEKGFPAFELEWYPSYSKKERAYTKKYYDIILALAQNAEKFVVATDYDIEGELIGWNILRFLCNQKDAKRMKFSTLTKEDLVKSYENIMPHLDFGQAYAGETRHYLDWLYGINLSVALINAIKKAGAFRILSIGRVQGPALALVVKKEKEISLFKPKPYWSIALVISNAHEITVKYEKDIFEKKEVEEFERLKGMQGIAKTKKENVSIIPLPPFDLTSLQIEAYKYGITPSQTLQITQQLYLAGLISYPRTSSQKLPESINYERIIKKLAKDYNELTKLLTRKKPIEGKKSDPAHPAIYPTGETAKLNREQKIIYELIARRFLACFASDALIEQKKITFIADGKNFVVRGLRILEKGWLSVYPARIDEKVIPDMEGKVFVKRVLLEEKQTQPPRRYTPASLVSELEKKNLGTKSTRASIIDTLYERGYIEEKQVKATFLGISTADALQENCPLIMDEKLTRKFEQEIDEIKKNKKAEEKEKIVLEEAKNVLAEILSEFKKNEEEIGKKLIEATMLMREKEVEQSMIMLCPSCKKGMLVIKRSRQGNQFLACNLFPECKTTFALPRGFVKKTEKFCDCGWPFLLLIKKAKRPWQFCANPECRK